MDVLARLQDVTGFFSKDVLARLKDVTGSEIEGRQDQCWRYSSFYSACIWPKEKNKTQNAKKPLCNAFSLIENYIFDFDHNIMGE